MKKKVRLQEHADTIWFAVMFLVYPLLMTNGFYNVTASKYLLFACSIFLVFGYIAIKRWQEYAGDNVGIIRWKPKEWLKLLDVTDKWVMAFGAAGMLSMLFASHKLVAFTGSLDMHMGFYFTVILIMAYYATKKMRINLDGVLPFIAVGLLLVVLFAAMQFLGMDPFGLLYELQTDQVNNYLSTIGNTAVYGQYIVLTGPVVAYAYLRAKNRKEKLLYGTAASVVGMAMLISNTDSTYLGIVIGFGLIFVISLRHYETFLRAVELMVGNMAILLLFRLLYSAMPHSRAMSAFGQNIIGHPFFVLIVLIVLTAVWIIMKLFAGKNRAQLSQNSEWKAGKIASKLLIVIAVLLAAFVFASFLYFSMVDTATDLGAFESYLRFSKTWGTERGYVWTWLTDIFLKGNIWSKLFGFGQGSVVIVLFEHYKKEMIEGLQYYFDNAHNVYLHYLITIGIVGLLTYLGTLFSSIRVGIKDEQKYGVLIGIAAYGIAGIFCILEPITLALIWIFLGILSSKQLRKE